MKRKQLALQAVLLSLVVFFGAQSALADYAFPTIELQLADSEINIGETFDVLVLAHGVTATDPWGNDRILSFGFDLNYDAAGLNFTGTSLGSGFSSFTTPGTDISAFAASNNVRGETVQLASLHFLVEDAGIYNIAISSDPGNHNEALYTYFYRPPIPMDASLEMHVQPVPLPATFLLLTSGLAGFFGCKKRRMA